MNRQIAEEAAEWAVRIDSGPMTARDRADLAKWLQASPLHVEELLCSTAILTGIEGVETDLSFLENLPLDGADAPVPLFEEVTPVDTVWPEDAAGDLPSEARRKFNPRLWALAASIAAVFLVSSLAVYRWTAPGGSTVETVTQNGGNVFQTAMGEQRLLPLSDGSTVYLNGDTRVLVEYDANVRRVELVRGEALFDVAHEDDRPFRVYAANAVTQAVGTQFDVRRTEKDVSIVVLEGKVLVSKRNGVVGGPVDSGPSAGQPSFEQPALVIAGQQAIIPFSAQQSSVRQADVAAATSWRVQELSFADERILEIAQEFNRYNSDKIIVTDPALGEMRISGVFAADDPASFVAFLELTAGVEVDRSRPGQVALRSSTR